MVILFEDTSLIALGFEGPLLEEGQESVLWLEHVTRGHRERDCSHEVPHSPGPGQVVHQVWGTPQHIPQAGQDPVGGLRKKLGALPP